MKRPSYQINDALIPFSINGIVAHGLVDDDSWRDEHEEVRKIEIDKVNQKSRIATGAWIDLACPPRRKSNPCSYGFVYCRRMLIFMAVGY